MYATHFTLPAACLPPASSESVPPSEKCRVISLHACCAIVVVVGIVVFVSWSFLVL